MGFGVVPVGSRTGGAEEVITDGTSGCLVPAEDVGGLAAVLGKLCEDRAHLRALAFGALRRFQEFPGWQQGMAAAVQYLHSLVRGKEG